MDRLAPQIERLVEAKQQRRLALAALPFPEKVRRVVELQKIAAPLWRQRGRKVRIWPER